MVNMPGINTVFSFVILFLSIFPNFVYSFAAIAVSPPGVVTRQTARLSWRREPGDPERFSIRLRQLGTAPGAIFKEVTSASGGLDIVFDQAGTYLAEFVGLASEALGSSQQISVTQAPAPPPPPPPPLASSRPAQSPTSTRPPATSSQVESPESTTTQSSSAVPSASSRSSRASSNATKDSNPDVIDTASYSNQARIQTKSPAVEQDQTQTENTAGATSTTSGSGARPTELTSGEEDPNSPDPVTTPSGNLKRPIGLIVGPIVGGLLGLGLLIFLILFLVRRRRQAQRQARHSFYRDRMTAARDPLSATTATPMAQGEIMRPDEDGRYGGYYPFGRTSPATGSSAGLNSRAVSPEDDYYAPSRYQDYRNV